MNRRFGFKGFFPVFALASMLVQAAAGADFASLAPADAYLFFSVDDRTRFEEALLKTPLAKMWNDPEIERFTAPMRRKLEEAKTRAQSEWGVSVQEIKALFPGQIALWAESLEPYKPDEWGAVLVAERTESPAKYRALMEKALEKYVPYTIEKSKESAGGTPMYAARWDSSETLAEKPPYPTAHSFLYAFPEGLFVAAFDGDESIPRLLARAKNKSDALAANSAVRRMLANRGEAFAWGFANLASIMNVVEENMAAGAAEGMKPNFEASGLRGLLDLGYSIRLREDRSDFEMRMRVEAEPKGFAAAAAQFGALDRSILRMAPSDFLTVYGFSYDIPSGSKALLDGFRALIPTAPMIVGMADGVAMAQTGMSLERDLIPAFGKEVAVCSEASKTAPDGVATTAAIALKNAETLKSALETFLQRGGAGAPIRKSEFLGANVYSYSVPALDESAPEQEQALIVSASHLIVSSSADSAKAALRRLSGKDADNFLDRKAGELIRPERGAKLAGVSISDEAQQMETVWPMFEDAIAMLASSGDGGLKDWIDSSALPQAETLKKYLPISIGYIYAEPDGFRMMESIANR
ncbi:MAG: hypothetical protein BWZ10_01933 [candidate division BRC1 bacterium ADurb.BinA364]|nr:MAG: hypothetical protein BWZ10_01933 [candidate division BRC1 bacterium ADurb.BinA364]